MGWQWVFCSGFFFSPQQQRKWSFLQVAFLSHTSQARKFSSKSCLFMQPAKRHRDIERVSSSFSTQILQHRTAQRLHTRWLFLCAFFFIACFTVVFVAERPRRHADGGLLQVTKREEKCQQLSSRRSFFFLPVPPMVFIWPLTSKLVAWVKQAPSC